MKTKIFTAIILLLVTISLILSWSVAGKLVGSANRPIGEPPKDLNATSVMIDGRIGAWDCTVDNSSAVLILCHGIRSSRTSMVNRAKMFNAEGFSTILIDLQAHGETEGDNITVGYLEQNDVKSTVAYAKENYPDQAVIVLGVSLGGASAILGSPLNIDGLIVESVYTTLEKAVHNRVEHRLGKIGWVPAKLLLAQVSLRLGFSKDELRPIENIKNSGCPVFVISGSDDHHTTENETRNLFNAASEPKQLWIVEGAGHIDLFNHSPEQYRERVVHFINSVVE